MITFPKHSSPSESNSKVEKSPELFQSSDIFAIHIEAFHHDTVLDDTSTSPRGIMGPPWTGGGVRSYPPCTWCLNGKRLV